MRYLPTSEVAETLGCSQDTVIRRINLGEIPAVNISTSPRPRFRVTEDALAAYLEAHPWLVRVAS